ncbi:D-Ala-D-Ala carboxypeptidase family metallohydrolase [Rhizobium sp. TRM95111]|uniref:D-Ala-D-Ala carboxypeptidase family metallohydrolase n=1 Tax=Rhizobium alarense TaxID=2846851 RepID=UPI001F33DC36|nr:D-Ala-D-Ala carboxypeptidase family metallohydrolase [Rhizobium alarense]MCF3639066.1 D-Ala-D-Ala carboxypeptidase family metallohydrolase [Rhizobium alarense]
MQEPAAVLKIIRRSLVLAASAAALAGCMTAASPDMASEDDPIVPASETSETAAEKSGKDGRTGYRDPMVAKVEASTDADPVAATGTADAAETDLGAVVMQPSSVNAGQTSIFASGQAATQAQDDSAVPAYAAVPSTNPALASIYSGSTADADTLPVEKMSVPATEDTSGEPADEETSLVPERVPLPKSGRMALVAEPQGNAAELALASEPDIVTAKAEPAAVAGADQVAAATQLPVTDDTKSGGPEEKTGALTLASLFAAKRKGTSQLDAEKATPSASAERKVLNRETVAEARRASFGVSSLPGVSPTAAGETEETGEDFDAEEGFTEVASLAGLARLAPNGLWLQTDRVKANCLKPELINVLKTVERHYGKPVIVTSALRAAKRNRARQSLHTRCEAADIQIAGVSKWELAEYLRTMPDRGGVGTYCHTESVHIDIGEARDWNWRCRRKKRK